MSSEWHIYTKLSIEDMVEKFRSLPIDYPSVFGFLADNLLLSCSEKNESENQAHDIEDPELVYTEHTAEEEYLNGFYEEEFGFRPVSKLRIYTNEVEHMNGRAFIFFIGQFLSDTDHFLVHGSTLSGPEDIYSDDYKPPDIYRFKA